MSQDTKYTAGLSMQYGIVARCIDDHRVCGIDDARVCAVVCVVVYFMGGVLRRRGEEEGGGGGPTFFWFFSLPHMDGPA